MEKKEYEFISSCSDTLFALECQPEKNIYGNVLLLPDIGESFGMYENFCEELCMKGFSVYSFDQFYSGSSGKENKKQGYIPSEKGREYILGDIMTMIGSIRRNKPEYPLFLISVGVSSLFARIISSGEGKNLLSGCIFVSTAYSPESDGFLSALLGTVCDFTSGRGYSYLLFRRVLPGYRDKKCASLSALSVIVDAKIEANSDSNAEMMPGDLPLLFVSGDKNRFGSCGEGVLLAGEKYSRFGSRDVTVKILKNTGLSFSEEGRDYMIRWLKERML